MNSISTERKIPKWLSPKNIGHNDIFHVNMQRHICSKYVSMFKPVASKTQRRQRQRRMTYKA